MIGGKIVHPIRICDSSSFLKKNLHTCLTTQGVKRLYFQKYLLLLWLLLLWLLLLLLWLLLWSLLSFDFLCLLLFICVFLRHPLPFRSGITLKTRSVSSKGKLQYNPNDNLMWIQSLCISQETRREHPKI